MGRPGYPGGFPDRLVRCVVEDWAGPDEPDVANHCANQAGTECGPDQCRWFVAWFRFRAARHSYIDEHGIDERTIPPAGIPVWRGDA
jgi:hypothetical protein